MLMYSRLKACLKHSNFLKRKDLVTAPHSEVQNVPQEDAKAEPDTNPEGGPVVPNRNSTTSFLTATTDIFSPRAGITAAAGTRLAL